MSEVEQYLRRSACARAAISIARQCQASDVGLVSRKGLIGILRRRFAESTVRHVVTMLRRFNIRVVR